MGKKLEGSRNTCPNNQFLTEKRGGHYASFVAMLRLFQTNNSVINFSAMNPGPFGNAEEHDKAGRKPYCIIANQHLALTAKRTGTRRRTKVFTSIMHVLYVL